MLAAAGAMAAFAGGAAAHSVTYENTVKYILAQRCLACHGTGSPGLADFLKDQEGWKKKMKGPRMDTYANLAILVNGTDAGAFMRRLDDGKNTKDAKPGNMYAYLGGNDAERAQRLDTMKKWVGNWSLKRRKELTEAELRTITAPEK
jgi:mono/diheme cytochrome c family protein